jgi:hypothetical protein
MKYEECCEGEAGFGRTLHAYVVVVFVVISKVEAVICTLNLYHVHATFLLAHKETTTYGEVSATLSFAAITHAAAM